MRPTPSCFVSVRGGVRGGLRPSRSAGVRLGTGAGGEHAADLTAEVFARAWLCRRRFRDEGNGSASPWLYGIARNVLLDSLRKQRVEQATRMRLGLPVEVAPDPGYDAVDGRLSLPEAALRAIMALPEAERELLLLRV